MKELTDIVTVLGSSPLHVILLVMVIGLWRRVTVLEDKLEKCLKDTAKAHPKA